MFVPVNGVRLFVEVLGPKLVPDGPRMRERPTIVALHGGPSDHAHMRELAGPLADVAQLILYDHRGCGRSEHGDPELWNMAQWGDDVRGLCDALGVERPIVIGASFGGFVAQSYAVRHPTHAEKLAFIVTGPRMDLAMSIEGFRRQGGDAAARAFEAMAREPSPATFAEFMANCRALYSWRRVVDQDLGARAITNATLAARFLRHSDPPLFDFRAELAKVTRPVLILGGDEDPIMPPPFQDELEAALTAAPVRRIRFEKAAHFLQLDAPETYFAALREFIV